MSNKKRVGYEAFKQWEMKMVEKKASGLIGKFGFTPADIDDLKQELLLHIYMYRQLAGAAAKANEWTWMSKILDNRLRNILEAVKTEKRKVQFRSESLHKELGQREGEVITYEGILREDHCPTRHGKKLIAEEEEMRQALALALAKLTKTQKKVYRLLLQGHTVTHVAATLGVKRTTLNDEVKRIRKTFYEEGLHEYV